MRALKREDFTTAWAAAAKAGTLLTVKHDPNDLQTPRNKFRTITVMPPAELEQYIATGDYIIQVYTNNDPKHSPQYCVIVPKDPNVVAGSGVPPMSTTPTAACDRFVAVSGAKQGWHLFAETAAEIQAKEKAGLLSLNTEFL